MWVGKIDYFSTGNANPTGSGIGAGYTHDKDFVCTNGKRGLWPEAYYLVFLGYYSGESADDIGDWANSSPVIRPRFLTKNQVIQQLIKIKFA